jgi:tetratricopeptide (TPR) repeat protein
MTANNLGVLYNIQGRLEEAKAIYERALMIFEKSLDPRHPSLVACRDNYEALMDRLPR